MLLTTSLQATGSEAGFETSFPPDGAEIRRAVGS